MHPLKPSIEASPPPCPLPGLRLGGLSFLNALPLQLGLTPPPRQFSPAEAVSAFQNGEVDAALLPVASLPGLAGEFFPVCGIGIAARDEAYSVYVAHRRRPNPTPLVYFDPASKTSRALLDILVPRPQIPSTAAPTADPDAADHLLLIGDTALEFRHSHPESEWLYEDLGSIWKQQTGLPMVFALWIIRKIPQAPRIAEWLREIPVKNHALREEFLHTHPEHEFLRHYWNDILHYSLGSEEERSISHFLGLLSKQNGRPTIPPLPWL